MTRQLGDAAIPQQDHLQLAFHFTVVKLPLFLLPFLPRAGCLFGCTFARHWLRRELLTKRNYCDSKMVK